MPCACPTTPRSRPVLSSCRWLVIVLVQGIVANVFLLIGRPRGGASAARQLLVSDHPVRWRKPLLTQRRASGDRESRTPCETSRFARAPYDGITRIMQPGYGKAGSTSVGSADRFPQGFPHSISRWVRQGAGKRPPRRAGEACMTVAHATSRVRPTSTCQPGSTPRSPRPPRRPSTRPSSPPGLKAAAPASAVPHEGNPR